MNDERQPALGMSELTLFLWVIVYLMLFVMALMSLIKVIA